ncbi:uncharacterized protein LOC62_07G009503 [Vanrija pseudolonga]|uniref:Uncharacterized protein n=1 Tax=Vanrija pseudolonga TaxID=143232 RepID=A0AAF0YFQ3_9TREE|nr:hypothetical protein LOC62_07G009503 [Vanrija pseudolonga]
MNHHDPPDTTPWLRRRNPSPSATRPSPPGTLSPVPNPPPAHLPLRPHPPPPPDAHQHGWGPRAPIPPRQQQPIPEYTLSAHADVTAFLLGMPGTDAPWYLVQASRYTPKRTAAA